MAFQVVDDRNRTVILAQPPRRIVSLVPSDTLTLALLGGLDRLVGRTDYCVLPEGVERLTSVGGTKDASAERILALAPDLVVANQEENSRPTLEKVVEAGVPLFIAFPKRVEDGLALVARYARMLGVEKAPHVVSLVREGYQRLAAARAANRPRRTVFCPIWADPLMTIRGDTYLSASLELAGLDNVFRDRSRKYPLAADLGKVRALDPEKVGERDTRYPRITEDELRAADPDVVVLPDEPHPFTAAEAAHFAALLPRAKVVPVDGKDLCWYGARAVEAIPRLLAL